MENIVKLGLNPAWLLAQLANFLLLFLILRAVAFKPILNMLDTRKKKIQESLEYAEKVKRDAEAQQKEFERKLDETRRQNQAAVAAAGQVAEKEGEAILAQARAESRKLVEQAKEQIEYERRQMQAQLREEVVRLSLAASQKVLSQQIDEKAHRQLVNDFLAQTDQLGNRN
ncbi:MAG: F0F1 ATP synthase subunit B [Chloroflexi bacterium]|nr:F0F1 ATP synthase subunit B [Chloroflexota bacterium]